MMRRRQRRGFTIVEVMMSIVVMTIGTLAIFGQIIHVVKGNVQARRSTIATDIAERWIERLKTDALLWDRVATPAELAVVLGRTNWLMPGGAPPAPPYRWQAPPGLPMGVPPMLVSNAFDFQGNDILPTDPPATIRYCASYRLAWVTVGRTLRADVRVFWPRDQQVRADGSFPGACAQGDIGLPPTLYGQVYLSTVLRWNQPGF